MSKLLLLGPRYHKSGEVGGIVVSFEMLLKELSLNGVDYLVIDTNKKNYSNIFSAIVSIFYMLFKVIPRVTHVSLHGTGNDYLFIAPFVIWLSNLLGKNVSLRKFGGSFQVFYEETGIISKYFIRYAVKNASLNFFQTRYLVEFFSSINPNSYWMPTARPTASIRRDDRPFGERFVFLGHVRIEKGIVELIEAANLLPESVVVDIYGPVVHKELLEMIEKSKANYKGVIKPEDVAKTLADYDVLVLPTFWAGEGYPGVIIEAFSVGVPVVATSLEGIKEIIDHKKNGYLIEPRNVNKLVVALKVFNSMNYCEYSFNAKQSFYDFEITPVVTSYLEAIGLRH